MDKNMAWFHIVMAFQHFAGKPLRALDGAPVLSEQDINTLKDILQKQVNHLRTEDPVQWRELHDLAFKIEEHLVKITPAEK
jgi:hypothetical protein